MDLFLNALKGQFNTLNFIILSGVVAIVLRWKGKRTSSFIVSVFTTVIFILTSTAYLPGYRVGRMESKYPSFDLARYPQTGGPVLVHVLGGGYTFDNRLPSPGKLSGVSLGRLVEGLRVSHLFNSSMLVVSGNIASGDSSMASVARRAIIELGFDSLQIVMLETPSTTQEEAQEFVKRFGTDAHVIVVTDALHMPRAMRFFKAQGIDACPAPTNYLIKYDDNPFALRWMPSVENFLLMDRVLREWLGEVKGMVVGDQ